MARPAPAEVAPAETPPAAAATPPAAPIPSPKGTEKRTPKPARTKRYNDWVVDPEL